MLARNVHAYGLGPVLELVPEGAQVFVTLDCDGLDPWIMPPEVVGPGAVIITSFFKELSAACPTDRIP